MLLICSQQQQELNITGGALVDQNRTLLYSDSMPGMLAYTDTGETTAHNNTPLNRSQGTPAELVVVVVSTLNIRLANHGRRTPRSLENDTASTQMKDADHSSHTGTP